MNRVAQQLREAVVKRLKELKRETAAYRAILAGMDSAFRFHRRRVARTKSNNPPAGSQ